MDEEENVYPRIVATRTIVTDLILSVGNDYENGAFDRSLVTVEVPQFCTIDDAIAILQRYRDQHPDA